MAKNSSKKTTTERKTAAKKTASKSKSTGLMSSNIKWMNWKFIVPVILIVALIGGYFVYATNAGGYTFIRRNGDKTRITGRHGTKKVDGRIYAMMSNGGASAGPAKTFIGANEAARSNKICAHFKVFKKSGRSTTLKIIQQVPGQGTPRSNTLRYTNASSGNICLSNPVHANSTISVGGVSSSSSTGVDTIYGK